MNEVNDTNFIILILRCGVFCIYLPAVGQILDLAVFRKAAHSQLFVYLLRIHRNRLATALTPQMN